MAWGLFKKVVVADRLGVYVDTIYKYPAEHNGKTVLVACVFFTFKFMQTFRVIPISL